MERFYPIGTPGEPWTEVERQEWFETRTIERSYADEVLSRIEGLATRFDVSDYGSLSLDPGRYPLPMITMADAGSAAPWVLISGGVHGYETSGVQGALDFVERAADEYRSDVNMVIAPCVSPWGYEVINRWNPNCLDPNRSFYSNSPAEESAALMKLVAGLNVDFLVHMDLHETTDSDEEEFRPAVAARDGQPSNPGLIPDGFYTVGDTPNPQPGFQAAIIAGVAEVTHIAPADDAGQIIGSDVTQSGVINYPCRELGLCAGMTDARFTTTTEVYPDSPKATPTICNAAQVAAVRAGLDFALQNA